MGLDRVCIDNEIDRRWLPAQVREGKVIGTGRAVDRRVVPERKAGAAQDRGVRAKGSVGIAREFPEGLRGIGKADFIAVSLIDL